MDIEVLSEEELIYLVNHPEEIETGCDANCDSCINEKLREIENVLEFKQSFK